MSSLANRIQTGARRRNLRLPNSLIGACRDGGWKVLGGYERCTFRRGRRRGVDGTRGAVWIGPPAAERASTSDLDRLVRENELKGELYGARATRSPALRYDGCLAALGRDDREGCAALIVRRAQRGR